MELGPQNRNGDGLLGPNSIIAVYMDPLGYLPIVKSAGGPGPRGMAFCQENHTTPRNQQTAKPEPIFTKA